MARLIKNTKKMILGVRISTVFENETVDRDFKIGDIVENLRYVENGEIVTVSGKVSDIRYTMATKLSWNKKDPKDTLSADMTLNDLVLDISRQYESEVVSIPIREIVEFADELDVVRMKYNPFIVYEMELKYSDLAVKRASVQIGDIFDNVRIMNLINPTTIGPDITGKFEVIGFSYAVEKGKIVINGIAFKNVDTNETHVADLDHILALNEIYNYNVDEEGNISEIVSSLADGDTITITGTIDTQGSPIRLTKKNLTVDLQANLISDASTESGIRITTGNATITGTGLVTTSTPYDADHQSGVVILSGDGELTFNGGGISAVIENDPASNGQFGVVLIDDAKLIINEGNFESGWYCVSGSGSQTNADSSVTINGGTFTSAADYAIYHPDMGKLVINGGAIRGAAGAIAMNGGEAEINGGEFSVFGGGDTGDWSDGTGGLSNAVINLNGRSGPIVCKINGGTFYATEDDVIEVNPNSTHEMTLEIRGGKFTQKPKAEWIAEGFVCTEEADANGFFEVVAA